MEINFDYNELKRNLNTAFEDLNQMIPDICKWPGNKTIYFYDNSYFTNRSL